MLSLARAHCTTREDDVQARGPVHAFAPKPNPRVFRAQRIRFYQARRLNNPRALATLKAGQCRNCRGSPTTENTQLRRRACVPRRQHQGFLFRMHSSSLLLGHHHRELLRAQGIHVDDRLSRHCAPRRRESRVDRQPDQTNRAMGLPVIPPFLVQDSCTPTGVALRRHTR